jgi:hypothetical protein
MARFGELTWRPASMSHSREAFILIRGLVLSAYWRTRECRSDSGSNRIVILILVMTEMVTQRSCYLQP